MRTLLLLIVLVLSALPAAALSASNDDFDEAFDLGSEYSFYEVGTMGAATVADDDPFCGSQASATVWYMWTAPFDGLLWTDTYSHAHESVLGVYTGSRGELDEVGCSFGYDYASIETPVVEGVKYYFMVGASSAVPGEFDFWGYLDELPEPPKNDDFATATAATLTSWLWEDTRAATASDDDPQCFDWRDGATVWYTLEVPSSTRVVLSTSWSSYDTTLSVWTGQRGDLTAVACNDDHEDLTSSVALDAVPGETYYVMVGSYNEGPGGWLELDVSVSAPERLDVELLLDRDGSFNLVTGGAVLTGVVACSSPADIVLQGEVRQRNGVTDGHGVVSQTVRCNGASQVTIPVEMDGSRFIPGDVRVDVVLSGCALTGTACGASQVTDVVRLINPRF